MVESYRGLLFINRNTLSDRNPAHIKQNPQEALGLLLNRFIRVIDRDLLKCYQLKERGFYGTVRSTFQRGQYSYNTLLALPLGIREELAEITLFQHQNGRQTPLNALSGPLIWRGINIPQKDVEKLLPYTAVYGGETRAKTPLVQLLLGKEIAHILQLEGSQNI